MYIKRVCLENWLRYAGHHAIDLEPTVYGIAGEWLGDEGRSNWVGKSALLEAIDFALTGRHRKRTEDEWITLGMESGAVELHLSNGAVVRRERKLGTSTKVRVDDHDPSYVGKEAERYLAEQVLGCTQEDFDLLYYAKQRSLAEVVMMKPEPFAEMVRQWVGTGPLEGVEDAAQRGLAAAAAKVTELETAIKTAVQDALEGVEDGTDYDPILGDPAAVIDQRCAKVERDLKAATGDVTAARTALESAMQDQRDASTWWEHKRAADAAKGKRAELDELNKLIASADGVGLELEEQERKQAWKQAEDVARALETQRKNLEGLTRGVFDGECPVMGAKCPAAKKVVEHGKGLCTKLVGVSAQRDAARDKSCAADNALEETQRKLRELRAWELRAADLEKEVRAGAEHAEYLTRHEEPRDKEIAQAVSSAQERMVEARVRLTNAEQLLARLQRRASEVKRALANVDDARARMARLNRIRRASGRQGAQRDVAMAAMRRVESLGNALLADAQIPLSFRVRWATEGKKLAGMCDACGHVYTGQRDKACPRCKVERPMHSLDRPGLELSDRSGAAEDLVGAAVRLGASAWLRRKRAMPWGVAMIDEPYGALDAANREAFSQYLVSSLRGRFGFEQAFIIAHHDDAMSSLPGRIRVVGTQSGSRLEVV